MPDNSQIRIILRSIQITDAHDLDGEGEFRFSSKVTTAGSSHELQFPDEFWRISDHPLRNSVEKIDKVLYEGPVGDKLVVEMSGEELDWGKSNDHLETYRREYSGPPSDWVGRHQPIDEGGDDPENLADWRITYDIELI